MTNPAEPPEKLLSTSDAAALAQIHPDTLKRWEARGFITSLRTPTNQRRYRESDLRRLIAEVGITG